MQESSGAKILIRGKGSAKDGGSSGAADDGEALHVFIEGSEDAVSRATAEVEKILFDPASAMRLKNEQLRQLAGRDSDSIYGGGASDEYQIELRVPNSMVGLIIGKGGDNILRIQSQLGVHAQIAKESDMKPGETLRSIVIRGNPSNVGEAKRKIDDIIEAQMAKQGSSSSSTGNVRELNCAFVVKLPVPNDKVGIIIGKGGMTIKGVQERTRSQVQIPTQPDADNPQVRTIHIGGDTKEAVDAAQMEIFMTLQQQQQTAQNAYNATSNALLLAVPDEKIGVIIGKAGSTVKDVQARLHVRIQIPTQPDIGSNPPVRTVSISGTPEAQAMAKYEIELIASGTPIASLAGNTVESYTSGGYGGVAASGANMWPGASFNMYAAAANPYGGYAYPDMSAAYYGQYGYGAAAAAATTPTAAAAAAASTSAAAQEVPTDPTAYYNDFWQYAVYYGEAAARVYYGAWSPPEGTAPPEGIVVAPAAAVDGATTAAASTTASDSNATTAQTDNTAAAQASTDAAAAADPDAAAKAWETYKKQVLYTSSCYSVPF